MAAASAGDEWASLLLDATSHIADYSALPAEGTGTTAVVSNTESTQLLAVDNTRKGFILTTEEGIVYIGIGFQPTDSQYSYRMKGHCVVEKDGYRGPVYALADSTPQTIYVTEIK